MSIFITGDTHIPIDISKLNSRNFDASNLTKDDYVIICGDFGAIWNYQGEDKEEKYWLDWLENKPFTTLFVDGNHECFPRLYVSPEEEWNGGKIHKIRSSVYHLMRGQVFTIDGMKFFTMGGASSHDKIYRIEGLTWWAEELPSDEEYAEALKNLDKHNWKVDYVITHCLPDDISDEISDWYEHDKLTNFLFTVNKDLEFRHWYCGHYHFNEDANPKFSILYDKVICI